MAFTYTLADIHPETGSSPSNVRFLLQDTVSAAPEFSDEEIAAVRAMRPADEAEAVKTYRTAAQLAMAKVRYYSRMGNVGDSGFNIDVASVKAGWEEIARQCAAVAEHLESDDVFTVVQGGRNHYQSWDGQGIGGDGWLY